MREKWQQECLLSLELPGRPGRPLLEQRAGASHSLFYFHIIILKQYEPSQHVALPFLYCYYYRYLHRIQVGNLQKCFNDSETLNFLKNPRDFAAGAAPCSKRGQVLLLLCCPQSTSACLLSGTSSRILIFCWLPTAHTVQQIPDQCTEPRKMIPAIISILSLCFLLPLDVIHAFILFLHLQAFSLA